MDDYGDETVMLYYGDEVGKSIRELAQSDEMEDKIELNYYR